MPKATPPTKNPSKKVHAASGKWTASASSSKLYSQFLPITLSIPSPIPIPSSSSKPITHTSHHIFIRPDTAKVDTEEAGRKLFVVNLPVDITERDLRVIFARWGVIESVDFTGGTGGDILEAAVIKSLEDEEDESSASDDDDEEEEDVEGEEEGRAEPTFQGNIKNTGKRRIRNRRRNQLPPSVPEIIPLQSLNPRSTPYAGSGLRNAHIVYLDTLPVQRAMAHKGTVVLDQYNKSEPSGIEYYLHLHSSLRPTLSEVKDFADSSMARFDHLQSLLLSSRAKKQGAGALVDEDGFTVVVRGGRYGRTGGRGKGVAGVGVATKGFKGDGVKGKGAQELPNFYRFQQVDQRRQGGWAVHKSLGCLTDCADLAKLRAKFEKDKAKVEEMKQTKRFKPY